MGLRGVNSYFFRGKPGLPLVVEPRDSAVSVSVSESVSVQSDSESVAVPLSGFQSLEQTLEWVTENRSSIVEQMTKYGGILFRGFPISSAADFEKFVTAIDSHIMQYKAGTADRDRVDGNVHTTTSMPAYFKLALHHEMAYRKETPSRIFFYCDKAPWIGGETTIADGRAVLNDIPRAIRERFKTNQVRFERKLLNATGVRKYLLSLSRSFRMMSWQNTFRTSDRLSVESILKSQGYKFEWSDRGDLSFWNDLSVVELHPQTHESVWFRPVHYFHFSRRAYGRLFYSLGKILMGKRLPKLKFTSGEEVASKDMDAVHDALESNEIYFKWKKGDVLCLDNRIAAHGRNRFLGSRRILVLMTSLT